MKYYIIYILLVISLFTLSNCNCEHCVDNISAENKKIPYNNYEIVEFQNDTLGSMFDTVFVKLGTPSNKPYRCTGGRTEDKDLCSSRSHIFYSNNLCKLEIIQFPNLYNNITGVGTSSEYAHINIDSISYLYNNKIFNARIIYFKTDSIGSFLWQRNSNRDTTFSFDNYIYITEPEIKLLQYSTVYKDGTQRIWKLKE